MGEDTWESESAHNGVCFAARPGRSHPEVRLQYFLRLSPLEMKANPQDRTTAVIFKHHEMAFITTCHYAHGSL